jgi:hypothetical protein
MTNLQIFAFYILPAMLALGGWAYSAYSIKQQRERRKHAHD